MIHHLFTIQSLGHPAKEHLAGTIGNACLAYAGSVGVVAHDDSHTQLTCAVWRSGKWLGYYRASFGLTLHHIDAIETPDCFEPLPCPKPAPAVIAPAFASCAPAAQQVAFMALESRARSLGLEAEEHRSAGHDELADILVGQQSAVLAALDVLKGVAR